MKISEVSKATGVAVSTIRFYEKQDLLPEKYIDRDDNTYRNYSSDVIEHLLMIKTVHSVGFSLKEITEIQSSNGDDISIDKKIKLLYSKLAEIEKQKEDLYQSEMILRKMLTNKINLNISHEEIHD
ncbi:MerR family transcriptional regulator [Paenibacillus taichungensis]|uniref:MerR family transcriptional regulator n=1 Tax=Paenibacillus taichungensis TaxID=484184 RepID=A0ABX2MET8_9BACL|nr:MerR family transcriptional regulator [Paenibacillus taichungensis]NUU53431.1 MerR family transcriptional regulator [Paenibacillus taichungensis]